MAAAPIYRQTMFLPTYTDITAITDSDVGQVAVDMSTMTSYSFNGTSWLPAARVIIKKEVNSVNAKSTGATLLYTLEASPLNFYPFGIVARAAGVGISGVTLSPTISIGSNATSYNNIANSSLLGSVIAALTAGNSLSNNVYSPALPGGTAIYANVTIAALATNYTEKFDILGYYDT